MTEEDFNPEDYAPLPAELFADEEEQLMVYADEEEVLDTTSRFLNIEGAEFGNQVFNALKEGHIAPIRTLIMIKKMQHLHDYFLGSDRARTNKEAKEYLKSKISNEVGKETYKAYGASISIEGIGGATTMDYSECGDLLLNKLYEIQKEINTLVKEREKYIKTNLPAESNTIGLRTLKEVLTTFPSIQWSNVEPQPYNVSPPVKFSREGIVVRFPKKR